MSEETNNIQENLLKQSMIIISDLTDFIIDRGYSEETSDGMVDAFELLNHLKKHNTRADFVSQNQGNLTDKEVCLSNVETYNPETHILIAKDEVPMGLVKANYNIGKMWFEPKEAANIHVLQTLANLIAVKMGG